MAYYKVRIEETLARSIDIEADSPEEARDIINKKYSNGEIILDSSDYVKTEFTPILNIKKEQN